MPTLQTIPTVFGDAVQRIDHARRAMKFHESAMAKLRDALESQLASHEMALRDWQSYDAQQQDTVRAMAMTEFWATGTREPHERIRIEFQTVAEYDTAAALAWAREHLPSAVIPERLDIALFDPVARRGTLDFVKLSTVPKVVLLPAKGDE